MALIFLVRSALGQAEMPEGYAEDAPFGWMGSLVFWTLLLGLIFLCCFLVGLGLALGLAVLAGVATLFGLGGVTTSLLGFVTTRKPQVGWRLLSMWMHAGFLFLSGVGIGGFMVPMIWPGVPRGSAAGMGALVGGCTGLAWGWVLALTVERSISYFSQTVQSIPNRKEPVKKASQTD